MRGAAGVPVLEPDDRGGDGRLEDRGGEGRDGIWIQDDGGGTFTQPEQNEDKLHYLETYERDELYDESQSSDAHSIIDPAFTNGHERGQLTPSANKTAQWGAMTVLVILQEIH